MIIIIITPKYRTKTWLETNDNTKTQSYEVVDQTKYWCIGTL